MVEYYLLVRHGGGILRGTTEHCVAKSECDAIELAKKLAVETGDPHEVYELHLIGCSTVPSSKFADYRGTRPVESAA